MFVFDPTGSDLRQVMTYEVDKRVRQCAALLEDHLLIGKLNIIGDMIANEAHNIINLWMKDLERLLFLSCRLWHAISFIFSPISPRLRSTV